MILLSGYKAEKWNANGKKQGLYSVYVTNILGIFAQFQVS
jgi:hypothetical protein